MENAVVSLHVNSTLKLNWKLQHPQTQTHNQNSNLFSTKTLIRKPLKSGSSLTSVQHPSFSDDEYSTKHTTLLVETYHEHHTLNNLIQRLHKRDSCPLEILLHDGDWPKPHFWAVVTFLKNTSNSNQILPVFDMWKNVETSRINEFNYEKIIGLLTEADLVDEAVHALQEMKGHGLTPSVQIYNSIIRCYSTNGKFDNAWFYFDDMKDFHLRPGNDTYDILIQGYGKSKMYDEIDLCLRKMKSDGCPPHHMTYNLLIREFSRAGLLTRMESVYRTLCSERMHFQSSTLVAMLEAYMNFGTLEKMEKLYKRLLNSRTPLKEDLVRKLAVVYIKNYMFSRLDDLGEDLASRVGRNDLVWCLRLLSHACLLSRKGMASVLREMDDAKVSWNVSLVNIMLLTYLKMKNFMYMKILLSEMTTHGVKPDLVTVGIVFDANRVGFYGAGALEMWRRIGVLNESVKIRTDHLVLTAYGKGHFLRDCENVYTSLEPNVREKKRWTYQNLIDMVMKHSGRKL